MIKKVLIAGITGFIGSHLADSLDVIGKRLIKILNELT